ncbi:hypothetical protein HKX48_003462 [Thoreauomyces humboldtii]|nr:hypothetical protein HKX48_003462 [Thoreauomyces humboldtii]
MTDSSPASPEGPPTPSLGVPSALAASVPAPMSPNAETKTDVTLLHSPEISESSSTTSGSPTTPGALDGLELDLDFASLSTFDLAGSDLIPILARSFSAQRSKLEETPVGRKVKSKLILAQQRLVHTQLRILQSQRTPAAVKNRDKFAFVIGVTNMWITALLLGMWPTLLPAFFVLKTTTLLLVRLILYKRKRWHYFMFDLCYFQNALLVLLILFPGSHVHLFCANWGLANGPVLVAITAWRNSLVFHSLDKMTSLNLHFDPPLTLFAIRWLAASATDDNTPSWLFPHHLRVLAADPPNLSFAQLTAISLAMYLFWQAAYWTFVWTMRADKIASGYATSTTWMLANHKSIIYRTVKTIPKAYQPAAFMFIQWVYTVITVSFSWLLYKYKYLHAACLMGSLAMATWNGANFYFDVFSRRYVQELQQLEKDLEGVSEKNKKANNQISSAEGAEQSNGTEVAEHLLAEKASNEQLRARFGAAVEARNAAVPAGKLHLGSTC